MLHRSARTRLSPTYREVRLRTSVQRVTCVTSEKEIDARYQLPGVFPQPRDPLENKLKRIVG